MQTPRQNSGSVSSFSCRNFPAVVESDNVIIDYLGTTVMAEGKKRDEGMKVLPSFIHDIFRQRTENKYQTQSLEGSDISGIKNYYRTPKVARRITLPRHSI